MIKKRRVVLRKRGKASFDPKTFLAKVGEGKAISEYQKDEIVFSQGDVGDAVLYIQNGEIKLTVISEHGKEAVVGILGPGQFFGEGCLNGHPLRVTTATAIAKCLITRVAKVAMIATMHDEPEFSELFMAYLLTRNSRIEEDLIDQLFKLDAVGGHVRDLLAEHRRTLDSGAGIAQHDARLTGIRANYQTNTALALAQHSGKIDARHDIRGSTGAGGRLPAATPATTSSSSTICIGGSRPPVS
jgi:CRP-like cAMP-binding protein